MHPMQGMEGGPNWAVVVQTKMAATRAKRNSPDLVILEEVPWFDFFCKKNVWSAQEEAASELMIMEDKISYLYIQKSSSSAYE